MKLCAQLFVRFWHATGFIAAGIASSSVPLILLGVILGVIMNAWVVPEMRSTT